MTSRLSLVFLNALLCGLQGCMLQGAPQYIQNIESFDVNADGSKLAFVYYNGDATIYTANIDGTAVEQFADTPSNEKISEGMRLALTVTQEQCEEMAASEVNQNFETRSITWADNGSIFASQSQMSLGILNLLALQPNGLLEFWVDGRTLLSSCSSMQSVGPVFQLFSEVAVSPKADLVLLSDGWVMSRTGGILYNLRSLHQGAISRIEDSTWSDNNEVACLIELSPSKDKAVIIFNLEKRTSRVIQPPAGFALTRGLTWSPHAEKFACGVDPGNGGSTIIEFSAQGTDVRSFAVEPSSENRLTRDGRSILRLVQARHIMSITKLDLETGSESIVVRAASLPKLKRYPLPL